MLPACTAGRPAAVSTTAASALVVLLPLVPVTHSVGTPRAANSARATPVPDARVVRAASARASSRYGLIPGDRNTTSQPASSATSVPARTPGGRSVGGTTSTTRTPAAPAA